MEKRKYYCEKEVELNRRLTDDIYLGVEVIREKSGLPVIGGTEGKIIDYAVKMRKLDRNMQMDLLLRSNKVTVADMEKLAEILALFHRNTQVIYQKDFLDIKEQFRDLVEVKEFLKENSGYATSNIIDWALDKSDSFIEKNKALFSCRLQAGFFRDCHGDLHSRNIFLLREPVIFDCIEFCDDLRYIDVLNEVAFLCMDIDAFGRKDLAEAFIKCYNELFPSMQTDEEKKLFVYYKSYRANVRAKVNAFRARDAGSILQKQQFLEETAKYLKQMDEYLSELT